MNSLTTKRLALGCLSLLAPAFASANIIPTGTSVAGAGPYVWTYDLQLSQDQDVDNGLAPSVNPVPHVNQTFGGFLTLFDFAGYVDGSCTAPIDWTCTTQYVGYTPDDVAPVDDPGLVNLTWVRTGGSPVQGQPGGVDLGLFTAASIDDTIATVSYASRGTKNIGSQAGSISDNVGNVQGPGPASLGVAEPSSLALTGLAVALAAALRARAARPGSEWAHDRGLLRRAS